MTTKFPRKPPASPKMELQSIALYAPVDLSDATWQRLEALIRQVTEETMMAHITQLNLANLSRQILPLRAVETPSLREANKAIPPVEEEKPAQEKQPEHQPRPRRTYGVHVQEVDEKGNWVNVS